MIHVGTCGFPGARTNVVQKLKAVEIQDTFYKFIEPARARVWRDIAPKGFIYTVKASQFITHEPTSPTYRRANVKLVPNFSDKYGSFRPSREVIIAWRRTEEICQLMRSKAVLFQCPASFNQTAQNILNLDNFFEKAKTDMARVWEPRGSWDESTISRICRKHGLIHSVDPFSCEPVTTKLAYFRLHGKPPGNRMYYYSYSDKDLKAIKAKCEGFDTTYVFFNNVSMLNDAIRLRRLLHV